MFKKFLKDETGLELSEYAVAAALVALAAIVAFQTLGTRSGRESTLSQVTSSDLQVVNCRCRWRALVKFIPRVRRHFSAESPRTALGNA